jgi:Protein of unknown function (DUF3667)
MSDAASPRTHCANCDHRLAPWDKFCSQCGQDTRNHPPTLWEFVHEFISHYIAAEGRLWKSLWLLMARPGALTLAYLRGHKQRYVLPLRLVLTLGLVFFLVLRLAPGLGSAMTSLEGQMADRSVIHIERKPAPESASESASEPASEPASAALEEGGDAASAVASGGAIILPEELKADLPETVRERLDAANAAWRDDPGGEVRRIGATMLALAPYAVLVSLPFFAGLLKLLFWRQPYGAHFVFALHLHAAWYGLLLLYVLLPWTWSHVLVWSWANLYPLLALRRVHAIGWWGAVGRGALLATLHWVLITVGLLLLFMFGALAHA